jgi:hypothetical protein
MVKSKVYDVIKKYLVTNYIQYGDIINDRFTLPKSVTDIVKSIVREDKSEIKKLSEKINSLNSETERMVIVAVIIDCESDKELSSGGLYGEFIKIDVKNVTSRLREISN